MHNRLTDQAIIKLCHDVQIGTGGMDYADALTAIAKELTLRGEQETPQEVWIPCSERFPEPNDLPVLAFASGYPKAFNEFNGVKVVASLASSFSWGKRITHWRPLPVAPPLPYQEEKETGR